MSCYVNSLSYGIEAEERTDRYLLILDNMSGSLHPEGMNKDESSSGAKQYDDEIKVCLDILEVPSGLKGYLVCVHIRVATHLVLYLRE